jgi:predicted RNase H-like HicB family nuclease
LPDNTTQGRQAKWILTPIFERVENGWIQGRIKELPEVLTAAPTREEAEADLADALHEYVASLQVDGFVDLDFQVRKLG